MHEKQNINCVTALHALSSLALRPSFRRRNAQRSLAGSLALPLTSVQRRDNDNDDDTSTTTSRVLLLKMEQPTENERVCVFAGHAGISMACQSIAPMALTHRPQMCENRMFVWTKCTKQYVCIYVCTYKRAETCVPVDRCAKITVVY